MNFVKSVFVIVAVSLIPSPSQAGSGFQCREYDLLTGKWGDMKIAVQLQAGLHDTDITEVATSSEKFTFYTNYEQSTTPHYRWGYAKEFKTALISENTSEPFGKLSIDIEYKGPVYNPDGESSYSVRAIPGYFEFTATRTSKKGGIDLVCKETK